MKHLALIAVLFASAAAHAAPINMINYNALTGTQLITFEDLDGGAEPGINYDAVIGSGGVRFGERFSGQTVAGPNDTLSGAPSGPLTLIAGAAGRNLVVVDTAREAGGNILGGLGPTGYPLSTAIGEGAISLLFSSDQSEFGFSLVGGDGGAALLSFFRRDGSLIDSVTITNLNNADYGFARDGGVKDVAGISISNTDAGGIGIDNLKHDVVSVVPEPAPSLTLLGGLLLTAWSRKAKRQKAASTHA